MRKKLSRIISLIIVIALMVTSAVIISSYEKNAGAAGELTPISITKSQSGNPMLGFDASGNILYGGDPSILVDGDTVYAYVGHDTSTNESYYMPDWRCYSSTDMINWEYESTIMVQNRTSIQWAANDHEAWAAQVIKYKDKYYFYYCTETNSANGGGKSIGVAVSDNPTGPFIDSGKPLVKNVDTTGSVHSWEDIDPTAFVDVDENGVEHRYVCWGNTRLFICEVDETMVNVMDQDGNPSKLSVGKGKGNDIVICSFNGMTKNSFTEAPWMYRQKDANGNYFGKYYLFYAADWREQMAYATCDDPMNGVWDFGGIIMEPSATSNTNHMAVFDFKGQTYFVYHDGSLPHGSGYRRVACVEPFSINEDGTIDYIPKTATGLTGISGYIKSSNGGYVAHDTFTNVISDSFYPIKEKGTYVSDNDELGDSDWEINYGKSDASNEYLVSIESNNKPGLYLTVSTSDNRTIVLSQDVNGSTDEAQRMTFKTYKGMNGSGVTFESVKYPGYYLTNDNGDLKLTQDPNEDDATFFVESSIQVKSFQALKTKRMYAVGDTLTIDDMQVAIYPETGNPVYIKQGLYQVETSGVDMTKPGDYKLKVTYTTETGDTYEDEIDITVVEAAYFGR